MASPKEALEPSRTTLKTLAGAVRELADALDLPIANSPSDREALCLAGRRVMEAPVLEGIALRSTLWQTRREDLAALLAAGLALAGLKRAREGVFIPAAWGQDLGDVQRLLAAKGQKWWRWLSGDYRRARSRLRALCVNPLPAGIDAQVRLAEALADARKRMDAIGRQAPLGAELFGPRWDGENSDWPVLSNLTQWVQELYDGIANGRLPDGIIDSLSENRRDGVLLGLVESLEGAIRAHAGTASVIRSKLAASQKDLLDLSLRNPLLNYRLLRTRGLEVVDEVPGEVFRILVQEGKAMSFLPRTEQENGDLLGQPAEEAEEGGVPKRHTDSGLQTALSSVELQTRLLSTFLLANTFIQEQGVNTLFLALGMVHWYESDSSQDARRAPLVLVPVELERSNVRERFRLRHTGEDIGWNLSLSEKTRLEFGPSLPGLLEQDDLDLASYFDSVAREIQEIPRWSLDRQSVVLAFFSFTKFLMYQDLNVENWPGDAKPDEHRILSAVLQDGFDEPDPLISSDDNLDRRLPPEEVHHVLDADGSQTLALVDVGNGRNLVVQGPPGTGKSQTIANIIAEAIGAGRTVLFVSEKMAALEVVKRRLDNVGLGDACLELHSHKTTRRAVIDDLSRTLDLGRPRLGQIEGDFHELAQLRERLNSYADAVNTPVATTGVTPFRAFGELLLLRRRTGDVPLPRLDIPTIVSWPPQDFRRKQGMVEELQAMLSSIGVPQEHPFWGSRLTLMLPTGQDQLPAQLAAAESTLGSLMEAATALADALGMSPPTGQTEAESLCLAAQRAMEAPNLAGVQVRSEAWEDAGRGLATLLDAGSELFRIHQEHDQVLSPDAWNQDLSALRQTLSTKGRKWWRLLSGEYRRAQTNLAGLCRNRPPSGTAAQIALVDAVPAAKTQREVLDRYSNLGKDLFGAKWPGQPEGWPELASLAQWVLTLYRDVASGTLPEAIIDFLASSAGCAHLEPLVRRVQETASGHAQRARTLVETLDLDVAKRFGSGDDLSGQPYQVQSESIAGWLGRPNDIHDIVSFNNLCNLCHNEGLGPVVESAESWPEAADHLADALQQAWFEGALEQGLRERPTLGTFDRAVHQQQLEKFRTLDSLSLEHNRSRLAMAHWARLPRGQGGGQLTVLRRQFEMRRRHLQIRQLMARAGNAIQAIKPVFMMSPLSIATYLAPGSVKFDLVIFDEASQVKPVDALGAIMRGEQIVVVGDSQQLPPTHFFDSVAQGGDDNDENVTADIESILGLLAAQNAPARMLRWHYRSRHESLIAVSNKEFYDNALVIFPSPDAARQQSGLKYHFLPGTVYDRGGSAANRLEAEAVAQAVMEHARGNPDLTLGVAAFSMAQTRAIQDQVELQRRQDPSCEPFFNAHPHEPFFVKNLETVQGDERDVMLISVGYGRAADGRVDMNFGPLNWDGGERRLNVLITRARLRCEVFTNLTADDIDTNRTGSRGVNALKTFLAYAEHGILEAPLEDGEDGDAADSAFEEAVADRLTSAGYQVRKRVGTGGVFVDIAVADPDQPGRHILGIECDGPTYHVSRSARDRDRLRQQVLEGLGWRIHRIWSPEWFRNPARELNRAVEAIEAARARPLPERQVAGVEPGDGPEMEREDEAEETAANTGPIQYDAAELDIPLEQRDLQTLSVDAMSSWAVLVVAVESPVHVDEVARRLAAALETRRGRRFNQLWEPALELAIGSGEVRREGGFLWSKDMEEPVTRDRRKLAPASRKLDLISFEEIAVTVLKVVTDSYGIDRGDVPLAVSRLLGFTRVTNEMRARIDPVIGQMINQRQLVQTGGHLALAEGPDD